MSQPVTILICKTCIDMYKKRKKCKFMVTVFLLSSAYELETHSCKCLAVCLAINIEQHKMCNDNIKKSISFPHFKKKKKKNTCKKNQSIKTNSSDHFLDTTVLQCIKTQCLEITIIRSNKIFKKQVTNIFSDFTVVCCISQYVYLGQRYLSVVCAPEQGCTVYLQVL